MDHSNQQPKVLSSTTRNASALGFLVSRLGDEITQVVQDMHGAFANPMGVRGKDYKPAPLVYNLIRFGFKQIANLAKAGHVPGHHPHTLLDTQSVFNGVFGQMLAQQNSPYEQDMTLVGPANPLPNADCLVIFLHGLCLNDNSWHSRERLAFSQWARDQLNADTALLRYNTGQHISDNGHDFAQYLASMSLPKQVVLIGHSMGGLVARSALHQGREAGHDWVENVTHLATLGSPHQGAVLERVGNQANRLLGLTPFSKPLMRLGNLRSAGIRDLRFGYVLEDQWRDHPDDAPRPSSKVPLDPHTQQLFIAATLSPADATALAGDWMVSVDSALAHQIYRDQATNLTRKTLYQLGHMGLLAAPETYQALRQWLETRH